MNEILILEDIGPRWICSWQEAASQGQHPAVSEQRKPVVGSRAPQKRGVTPPKGHTSSGRAGSGCGKEPAATCREKQGCVFFSRKGGSGAAFSFPRPQGWSFFMAQEGGRCSSRSLFGDTPLGRASAEISVHTPRAPTLLLVLWISVTEGQRDGGMCEG